MPAKFIVAPPSTNAAAPRANATRRTAVFIAHGMGQQIPYETTASVAEGLRFAAGDTSDNPPMARSVQFDGTWLQRIELLLKGADDADVETHVYEGYWAPLTEGKINIRHVVTFLIDAARNGIKNSESGRFDRMMFGTVEKVPIAVRTIIYLLGALLTVLSLVAMNTTIAVVSAARALLTVTPPWLGDGLFIDLTTTFNAIITIVVLFAAGLFASSFLKRLGVSIAARNFASSITLTGFVITLAAIILAGVSLPFLFYGHVRGGVGQAYPLWGTIFSPTAIERFNATFDTWGWIAIALVAAGLGLKFVWGLVRGIQRDFTRSGASATLVAVFIGALVSAAAIALIVKFISAMDTHDTGVLSGGLAWVLLVAVSGVIRQLLVQFVGDVAIYVAPYKLDQFYGLRAEIKECVLSVARRVYKMKDAAGKPYYDRVILVAHSLGTVVTYDALNALIREEEAGTLGGTVLARTPLFLTFGSPLDKTAFIFAGQARAKGVVAAREAMAVTKQPMIADYKYRPARWLNIHSRWDIISGALNLYDSNSTPPSPKAVDNREDPEATTLLTAHTEYWRQGSLLFKELLGAV